MGRITARVGITKRIAGAGAGVVTRLGQISVRHDQGVVPFLQDHPRGRRVVKVINGGITGTHRNAVNNGRRLTSVVPAMVVVPVGGWFFLFHLRQEGLSVFLEDGECGFLDGGMVVIVLATLGPGITQGM